ncbi:hypothetical protein JOF29_002818 [Kribbella aluminosa]|uniref:PIN domain-containing protein n=1 Tax=Kribbella aluminosa TaxID=416017 RepID=A0ABS4UJF7_9ACTN|nr:hypothetical protein [Kribbella aluminosa]MBP2351735.1 hypothetical protein [Kribbella aluminosa]
MATVYFIDTSVFCNILPIPGRAQDRDEVLAKLIELQEAAKLILPVTAVIETGNFIAQLPNGRERRQTAEKFVAVLRLIIQGRAPWVLHEFSWGPSILENLVDGAGTGLDLVEQAVIKVGAGDLTILAERNAYARRTETATVLVWSLDSGLNAFA